MTYTKETSYLLKQESHGSSSLPLDTHNAELSVKDKQREPNITAAGNRGETSLPRRIGEI